MGLLARRKQQMKKWEEVIVFFLNFILFYTYRVIFVLFIIFTEVE